ncbi:hypothetical protein [Streptomyces flavofungini]|uniref:hypothetical protein n=1 Tax=Streptomyces flavofungini TaxID=68200 RepID=UPI0025B1F405|nr:hypothetical protein [Streptomyces flavofungini]WJV51775.1 hypothetical protein QUY26_39805 [Streptomyces flavofungini]
MTRAQERDETDTRQLRTLVRDLVVESDQIAAAAGRKARRTLQEMAPGHKRQPVLILHRPLMTDGHQPRRLRQDAEDSCPLCGWWKCRCDQILTVAPALSTAPATASGEGQCSSCGQWFREWNGGVCEACGALGH